MVTSSGADFKILVVFGDLVHVFKWRMTFVLALDNYQVDVFLCKNDCWVQKKWSHCLKIKSISGMTSSIKNLGKFGELYLMEKIQPGDCREVCKGMLFYAKWDEESKKTSFETWKAVKRLQWLFFGYFLRDWISQNFKILLTGHKT